MTKNYYKILDISQDASIAEIKRAFRKKAKEYHPELNNTSEAEDNFILVNEAYDILIHPKAREIHTAEISSFINPLKNPSYAHWVKVAQERALVHLRLPYNEFTRTKFYQSTNTLPYLLFVVEMIVGILLLCFSLFTLWYADEQRVLSVVLFLASLPIAIFLIVQAAAGFASMSKFKKIERKRKTVRTT